MDGYIEEGLCRALPGEALSLPVPDRRHLVGPLAGHLAANYLTD